MCFVSILMFFFGFQRHADVERGEQRENEGLHEGDQQFEGAHEKVEEE